jgi:hypothetical protein
MVGLLSFPRLFELHFIWQAQGFENWFKEMEWGGVWQCREEEEDPLVRATCIWYHWRGESLRCWGEYEGGRSYEWARKIHFHRGGELEVEI